MGAWGVRPRDNDASADLADAAFDHGVVALSVRFGKSGKPRTPIRALKRLTAQDKWEAIGALETLLGWGACVPHTTLRVALCWLKELAKDERWLSSWFFGAEWQRMVVQAYVDLLSELTAPRKVEPQPRGRLRRDRNRRLVGWANWPFVPARERKSTSPMWAPYARFAEAMRKARLAKQAALRRARAATKAFLASSTDAKRKPVGKRRAAKPTTA